MPVWTSKASKRQLLGKLGAASLISLLAFAADRIWQGDDVGPQTRRARASQMMQRALDVVREHREQNGLSIDLAPDPNATGLIGVEYSEITTTVGDLEAKRTTTNPAMASLMVELLEKAGVGSGDRVAVGCSGSFPGLFVATLSAMEALGAEPIIVISLGASSYGANRLDFTLVELSLELNRHAVLLHRVAGASLGGSGDRGLEFEPVVRASLEEKIRSAGIPLLSAGTLLEAVGERLAVYGVDSCKKAVKAFVNIGGGSVDMGTDPWILELGPGLHRAIDVPGKVHERGVLLAMAERGIPVIHLLNIKGLARKHGIPWDPVPYKEERSEPRSVKFWAVLVLYLCGMSVVSWKCRRQKEVVSNRG